MGEIGGFWTGLEGGFCGERFFFCLIIMKPDTVCRLLRVFLDIINESGCLLKSDSLMGSFFKTVFEELNEIMGIDFADSIKIKLNPIKLIRVLIVIVIKLDIILSDELEYDQSNSEKIRLVNIVFRGVSHL